MTTTVCARQWSMLKSLGIQIVICEEAGEVMEAQSLCSLFPTVEHAILIGDPLQLRPQVNEPLLSVETDVGSAYRLDESLMERLMLPSIPNVSPLPASRLNLQRRMHPHIANVMRKTLYPYLEDHPSTYERAPVPGMADRIWWLNHNEPEDAQDQRTANPTSSSNAFEVEMVAGLVEYLVSSNEYEFRDITVLTPYNGQLAAFSERFKSICSLWLSEKDREALLMESALEMEEQGPGQSVVEVGNMLKLSTIDNFQGEESKVVILSTVRSNSRNRTGFLKTPNRINVGCSRARDGFYIVGNASLMGQVPMWQQILDELTSKRKIGPHFRVCCSRHPKSIYRVGNPQQWYKTPQCQIPCDFTFYCGHTCPLKCHADILHERQGCLKPCKKLHEPCKHPCVKECHDPCGECQRSVSTVTLECGHKATMTCAEASEGKNNDRAKCEEIIGTKLLPCGHCQSIQCLTQEQNYRCQEPCLQIMKCGHTCHGNCHDCRDKGHPRCQEACQQKLRCAHRCASKCHQGACPPCELPCSRSCQHGHCNRPCGKACELCQKPCKWSCEHQGQCSTLCCLPCNKLPCNEPCNQILPCGHICPSICAESCPKHCLQCSTGRFQNSMQIFLPCGHNFDVDILDRRLNLAMVYKITSAGQIQGISRSTLGQALGMKTRCPTCGASCKAVRRYQLIDQLNDLTDSIDRIESKFAGRIHRFLQDVNKIRCELNTSFARFCQALSPGPLAAKRNEEVVMARGNALADIETSICKIKGDNGVHFYISKLTWPSDEVATPFQDALTSLSGFFGNSDVLQEFVFASTMQLQSLYFRCRLTMLEENIRMLLPIREMARHSRHSEILADGLWRVTVPQIASQLRTIGASVSESRMKRLPRLEAELRLTRLASQVALEKGGAKDGLMGASTELDDIMALCQKYPQTAGLLTESCHKIKPFIRDAQAKGHPLYSKLTRDVWWTWPRYGTGDLQRCTNGHPYSGSTTSHCPECGPEAVATKLKEIEPNAALRVTDFVAAMKTRSFDSLSYRS